MKCCVECGSTNIILKYRVPGELVYLCKECGWEGHLVVDFPDESLMKMKEMEKAEKVEKKVRKYEKMAKKSH